MPLINTYTCLVFTNEIFPNYTFSYDTQNFKKKSPLSFEEKKKLLPAQFSVEFVMFACAINCASKLICLHACLHERDRVGLIGKPD